VYSKLYRQYVATVLLLVYVFNQLDRRVFDILMEPVKRQFSLTDAQLGFLAGPALVVVYSCLGIPVARWADRRGRIAIMTCAVGLWSFFAASTATVHHFWQLALARVGVGVGEAGFSAVAISVICDYEDDQNRARAISNFMLAIPIAGIVSNLMGGWVNQLYGWRWVFVIAGVPGVPLAALMWATVREPTRRLRTYSDSLERPPFRAVLSTLWQRQSLRHLVLGLGANTMVAWVIGWLYVLFIRQHHMTTGELGSWFALTEGVGTLIGIWLGGFLATRLGTKDASATTRLMTLAGVLVAPLASFVLWCPSKHLALLGYLLLNIAMYFAWGPTTALVQDLVGSNMRATMASLLFLTQMLAGGVIGTQLVGVLSDALAPIAGNSTIALRWSMTLGSMVTLWSAMHFWRAGRYVRQDLVVAALSRSPEQPGPLTVTS
jgi:MFS family permease